MKPSSGHSSGHAIPITPIASGIASFSRTEMLVVLVWSITSHLLVFGTIFLVLRLLRAIACRFRASAKAWFLLRSAALALLGMTVLSKIVLNAVSFNDLTADFYAASLSFVLITFLSGLVIGLDRFAHADESSRLAVSRLKQLLPAQEASGKRARGGRCTARTRNHDARA